MNKKIHVLAAIALCGLMTGSAFAQTDRKLTCATWAAERSQEGGRALQVQSWLDGYLSGLSVGSGDDYVTKAEQPSSYLWMDNYCRNHPLDDAANAGVFLMNEELKKKRPYKHQY